MSVVQSIDYAATSPVIVLGLTAIAVLVLDLFLAPGRARRLTLAGVSLAGTLGALAAVGWLAAGSERSTFCVPGRPALCSYSADHLALFIQGLVLAALAVVILLAQAEVRDTRLPRGEFHFLLLASVTGMLTLASARDLITLLVALEVVSVPAFVLVGLRRGDPRSSEAALKFFLVSVLSTALSAYGMSLVYGATGSIHFSAISAKLATGVPSPALAAAAVVLALAGFIFKASAVPFHVWAPDTYQGAPISVAAFLSVASKAAGFAGILVLTTYAFRPYASTWGVVLAVVAALTMTVGNLVALRQWHMVRLLAWSAIAQAGYILVPLGVAATAAGRTPASLSTAVAATLGYLGIYAAMNLGAFACVAAVARHRPRNAIADYRGLVRTSPWLALGFAFFLVCLAGLPPGVAGLFAKVVVFRAAVSGHVAWLAVIAAVNSVIGLAYYLRVAALLFVGAAERAEAPAVPAGTPRVPAALAAGLAVAAAVTVVLSVYPQVLLHAAEVL